MNRSLVVDADDDVEASPLEEVDALLRSHSAGLSELDDEEEDDLAAHHGSRASSDGIHGAARRGPLRGGSGGRDLDAQFGAGIRRGSGRVGGRLAMVAGFSAIAVLAYHLRRVVEFRRAGAGAATQLSAEHRLGPDHWQAKSAAGRLMYHMAPPAQEASPPMPSFGNGYAAARLGGEWMYLAGIFNGAREKSHRARVPAPFRVFPKSMQLAGSALDLELGIAERLYSDVGTSGGKDTASAAVVLQRMYFHQAWKHVVVAEVVIDNRRGSVPAVVELTDGFHTFSEDFDIRVATEHDGVQCIEGMAREAETELAHRPSFSMCRSTLQHALLHGVDGKGSGVEAAVASDSIVVHVGVGEQRTISLPSTMWTSSDSLPGHSRTQAAEAQHNLVASLPSERLLDLHDVAMKQLWSNGIEVEGNSELAKLINSSYWSVLASVRDDRAFPVSPGGLAGECYGGHAFWDAEQLILPTLMLFHPGIARQELVHRADMREAAAAQAEASGLRGFRFPVESGATGVEVSPWKPAVSEVHVTGDVSMAFWRFWQATGDSQWLFFVGWPVLRGVARFFASRAWRLNDDGAYSIKDVIDIDQGGGLVVDSAYTNAVARFALERASKAAELVGAVGEELTEAAAWAGVAKGLRIPFDARHGVHAEYAISVDAAAEEGEAMASEGEDEGTGLGVVMLQYPLDIPKSWTNRSEVVRRNDLLHFGAQGQGSDEGPTSWWAVAISWLGLGESHYAAEVLMHMIESVRGPFRLWSEAGAIPADGATSDSPDSPCSESVSAAGAFLQVIWAGYAGVRLTDEALLLVRPSLPLDADVLTLKGLSYRGNKLHVRMSKVDVRIRVSKIIADSEELFIKQSRDSAWTPLPLGAEVALPGADGSASFRISVAQQACDFVVVPVNGEISCTGDTRPLREDECRRVPEDIERLRWIPTSSSQSTEGQSSCLVFHDIVSWGPKSDTAADGGVTGLVCKQCMDHR